MRSFLFLAVCFLLCSCAQRKASSSLSEDFGAKQEIYARDSIGLEAYGILNPLNMVAGDDSLWLVDDSSADAMVYLLTAQGKLVAKGIGLGNGPGEVLEVTSLHRIGGCTYVYDARSGQVCRVQRRDSTLLAMPMPLRLRLCDDVVSLPQGRMLALPVVNAMGSYRLVDETGAALDSLSYYPERPDGVSDFTHALACVGALAVGADGTHFARALVYDGGVDFFSLTGASITHVSRYEQYGMDYDVLDAGQPVPTLSPATRVGFPALASSRRRFYALFSDELAADNPMRTAGIVCAFSQAGKPLRQFQLDRNVSLISVSADDSVLYAVGDTGKEDESISLYLYSL